MANRPNILYVFTDQQSGDAMSCVGHEYVHTPAMDRLAETGTTFNKTYCTQPVCSPSRASMFTGLMPHECSVPQNNLPIKEELRSYELGNVLRAAGYDCAYAGKWHIPMGTIPDDGAHGFRRIHSFGDHGLAESCIRYLEEPRQGPFFLVASFDNPHNICEWARCQTLPYGNIPDVPTEECPNLPANFGIPPFEPEVIRHVQRRNPRALGGFQFTPERWRHYRHAYYRLIEKVDAEIGKILDALQRLGLEEDTVIIFSSDHGDGQGAHQWNQKVLFYEEQVRVPFIVSWKGMTRGGVIDDTHLVSNGLDLFPTICDYAGVEAPEHVKGLSVRPLAEGREPATWRQWLAAEYPLRPLENWLVRGVMIRTSRYKYIAYDSGQYPEQLFDLEKDPGEMVNRAVESKYKGLVQGHRDLLRIWCRETGFDFGRHGSHPNVPFLAPGDAYDEV